MPSSFPSLLVSDFGDVIRMASSRRKTKTTWQTFPEKQLTPCLAGSGYLCIYVKLNGSRKTAYVHRLVAEAFLGKPKFAFEVNHLDGDKTNNRLSNLEWITHSENLQHAYRTRLLKGKITPKEVNEIRNLLAAQEKPSAIAVRYGIQKQSVRAIKTGKTWAWLDNQDLTTTASKQFLS